MNNTYQMITNDIHVKKTETIIEALNFIESFIEKMEEFKKTHTGYNYSSIVKKINENNDKWEIQLQFWNGTDGFKSIKDTKENNGKI